jgi:hypothetical protein
LARTERDTVEQNGTSAALAFAAAILGPSEIEFIAENFKQRAAGIASDCVRDAVDG